MTPRDYLMALELHGIKLGLETITRLLERAGQPQQAYPTVHVAGTNGKGSVLAVMAAILRAAGYRTGRFTSPHLIDISERFLVDGQPIDDAALDENIEFFRALIEEREGPPPTFFELNTAIAFRWLAQQRVDCGLIEVGMGGRFDSTNVLDPEICIITTIDLDHTAYLGDTLEAIAFEKAGILKPGCPVVVGEIPPGPLAVIEERAQELECLCYVLGRDFHYRLSQSPAGPELSFESPALAIDAASLALRGGHQGANAALAIAATQILTARSAHFDPIDETVIRAGLQSARWPCRLERVMDDPPVVIDVAHNRAGAEALAAGMEIGEKAVIILAASNDKDVAGMIDALSPLADPLILTQFQGRRALPLDDICAAVGGRPHERFESLQEAIVQGLRLASRDRPLLITGSIFTAGEARGILSQHHGAPPLEF